MSNASIISTPADRLATVFGWILAAVRRGFASNQARLEGPVQVALYGLMVRRIAQTRDRLIRLAARLQAGWTYQPKPYAPRHPPAGPRREPNPLTTGSHWLFRSVPGPASGAANAALNNLLAEPEIAAVLAAAPKPAWRILRSVCWMLGVEKPQVLAKLDPRAPKPGKPLDHPPPPLPWTVLPPTPELPDYQPSFFWPWIGPKPKTA
jgi:hypothetical protein